MTDGIDATLGALAEDTRRSAVEELARGPLSAGELATRLGATPAALTRHLRVLREAGLVQIDLDPTDARRHIYTIRPDPLRRLTDWSRRVADFWTSQLDSYRQHASGDDAGR